MSSRSSWPKAASLAVSGGCVRVALPRAVLTAAMYLLASAVTLLLVFAVLDLWSYNFRVPLAYEGDSLFVSMWLKLAAAEGWYVTSDRLAAPFGSDMHDYPSADNLNFLLAKGIGLFTHDFGVVINVFYLFTFVATTLSALFVLRQLRLSYPLAFAASIIYTFLPYHFLRGENHLSLASYWTVPLFTWLALRIGEPWLQPGRRRQWVLCLVIAALLTAAAAIYYAYFACFLLLVVAASHAWARKDYRVLIFPTTLIAAIFLSFVLNLSPQIIYMLKHGSNDEVAHNASGDAETYGLKVTQLVLPVSGHRLEPFSELRAKYDAASPLNNENGTAGLGSVGVIGFVLLVAYMFVIRRTDDLLANLSHLNLAGLLFGLIGGIGSLVALGGFASIRGYNRLSVYIAFFALAALFHVLQQWWPRSVSRHWLFAFSGLLVVAALYDQTTPLYRAAYPRNRAEFASDEVFVRDIERALPAGAMIYQLPFVRFPESPPQVKMTDYALLKGFLHSKTLRWSYGAMKGREPARWERYVSELPPAAMLDTLVYTGFSGIYIDRYGYQDGGAAVEGRLALALGLQPAASPNGRLSFFNISDYARAQRANLSPAELEQKKQAALHPIFVDWSEGFYGLERNATGAWRWARRSANLVVTNRDSVSRELSLSLQFYTGYPQPSRLQISGLVEDVLTVSAAGQTYSKTLSVPPGVHTLLLTTDAPRVNAPGDPRTMFFRVVDLRAEVAGPAVSPGGGCAVPAAGQIAFGFASGPVSGCRAVGYLRSGWSQPGQSGVWTEGNEAVVELPLGSVAPGGLKLSVIADSIVEQTTRAEQRITLLANGQNVGSWTMRSGAPRPQMTVDIPEQVLGSAEALTLTFRVDPPIVPREVAINEDTRRLGLRLRSIVIQRRP